jgi:two-component system, LuxR family, response regulator FixJ
MPDFGYIALVDSDAQRRTAVRRSLLAGKMHVEPFESDDGLISHCPNADLILVHNDGNAVASLNTHMCDAGTWMPIIGYSELPTPSQVVKAVLDGVVDYLAWPFVESDLATAMANAGQRADQLIGARQRSAMARSRIKQLTQRERQVLSNVALGLSNRKIAEKLGISSRTVEIHRSHALGKIGAHHTSDAIRMAIEAEII